jgi:hypothetical protein
MRRLLLALLIALLPLRGWVADAMALPAPALHALISIAEKDHSAPGSGPSGAERSAGTVAHGGCHDQNRVSSGSDDGDDSGSVAGCSTCTLCHSAVIAPRLTPGLSPGQPPAARPALAARFASAAPAPGFKPPIS